MFGSKLAPASGSNSVNSLNSNSKTKQKIIRINSIIKNDIKNNNENTQKESDDGDEDEDKHEKNSQENKVSACSTNLKNSQKNNQFSSFFEILNSKEMCLNVHILLLAYEQTLPNFRNQRIKLSC